jgi:hypothetical protein
MEGEVTGAIAAAAGRARPPMSMGATHVKIGSTPVNIRSTHMKIGSTPVNIRSTHMKIGSTLVNIRSTHMKIGSTLVNIRAAPEKTRAPPLCAAANALRHVASPTSAS